MSEPAAATVIPEDYRTAHAVSSMAGDMKFVGIYYIIIGALTSLSIIGAIIGIPLIISGLRIREAADHFKYYGDSRDESILIMAMEKQKTFFLIHKILAIVSIALFVLYILFFVIIMGGALLSLSA